MIVHVLSFFRPRHERDLIRARAERARAYEAHVNATERQDTRSMAASAARLRQATNDVLRIEVGR